MLWWLAQNALLAGLLAVGVAVACRVGRFRPAVRHALWLVVLLKLLTPPFLTYPGVEVAVGTQAAVIDHEEQAPEPVVYQILVPVPQDAIVALDSTHAPQSSEPPIAPAKPLSVPPVPTGSEWHWPEWIGPLGVRVLFIGTAAMALLQLVRIVQLRRMLASGTPAPSALVAEVEAVATMLGVQPPIVRILPKLDSPFVCGLHTPVLLWPAELSDSLSLSCQRAVLVHELAHLRRRDHWIAWLRGLAGCVWWWNPVYWIVSRQLGRNAELACDAWVIASLPDARRDYAEALLAVAGRWSRTAALAPAVGMSGSRRDFERRLVMVMRDSVPCKVPVLGLIAVGVLTLGVLPGLTLSQQEQKPAKIVKPAEPTQSAPADPAQPSINEGNFQLLQPQEFVVAYTQAAPAQGDDRDRKIKELEDKLQAILKEVKDLRQAKGANQTTTKPKITEKPATVTRVPVELKHWTAVETQPAFNVTFVDSGTVSKEHTITLSRATYKLPKEKADALAAFLKHVKASVLETKVEDDGVTVTTTPDVQHTIAQLVGLLTGQPHAAKGAWKYSVTPTTAAVPANAYTTPVPNAAPTTTPAPANAITAPKSP
jgi:beta-lactamase regulating signal transducer with metallopeptidase domain